MQTQNSTLIKQSRKTRRGWLGYKVRQVHQRTDIPCGLQHCSQHNNNSPIAFYHDVTTQGIIYFIDNDTIIEQTDIIYNCNEIKNVCFLQSGIQKMKKKNLNKYNAFKSHLQVEAVGQFDREQMKDESEQEEGKRNFWIFADQYHRIINERIKTKADLIQNLDEQEIEWIRLQTCAQWYEEHIEQLKVNYRVQILTTKKKQIQKKKSDNGVQIKSLLVFLRQKNSSFLDFLGFNEQQISEQMEEENIFEDHIQVSNAKKMVKEGKLFEAKYMAEKSYFKIGKTIYKIKMENNRALFGDLVAVEISPFQSWEKRVVKTITQEQDQDAKLEQLQDSDLNDLQSTRNFIKLLEANPHLLPVGRIKSILKRNIKQYCGSANTQKIVRTSSQGWKMLEFKPADDRYPLFYIRTFNVKSLEGKRIQVALDSWPTKSTYPLCHFVRVIGNIGDSKAQGDVILLEHNVEIKQFSRKAYQCLPKQGSNFKIPKQQEAYRLDLRGIDVCSIDPPGCKDIDDALHCIKLPNGNFQIGVHIADVSYYVRPDSALDLQARNRCTTVYLVDRRTDMLPKLLTENLCSLRADVDRLSFSTIWEIDENANIVKTKYCKTIIRSRRAFTYMQAQELMQSDSKSNLAESIRNLNRVAKKLKQRRLKEGALTLASTQVKITLEEQTHSATDVQLYQMVEANYLIQQFMLLANIAVAQKIYTRFPSISILRRHTPPKVGELEILKQILSFYNFSINYETSKALADSLDKIQKVGDPFFNKLIRILTTRCMNEATYFCSADFDPQQFYHYGLAAPFYTHFTSPIRRYADILVHRLLSAAIDLEPLPNFMVNKIKMTKVCEKMNMRNRMARYASRASSDYHTYQFFKEKEGEKHEGIITSIAQNTVTIMLVKFGLECKYELEAKDSEKTLNINKGSGVFNRCFIKGSEKNLFEYVNATVKVEMKGFHKKIAIDIL